VKIVISLNERKLKGYLKSRTESFRYICMGEKKGGIVKLLNKRLFEEIKIDDCDEAFKERFVKNYIDLIGQLGAKYNSIYWWVTGTSAKNQFASKFFENLFAFHAIIDKIEKLRMSNADVLIIEPPHEIVSSISKYCKSNSIELEILASPVDDALKILKGGLTSWLITIFFIFQTWWRIYLSNRYLKKSINRIKRNEGHYVLRSWFYSKSINENNEYLDSFFGVLPDFLVKKGKRLLIIAGIWGNYRSIVKKIAQHSNHLILPQELLIGYDDPVKAAADVHFNRIKIREKIYFNGLDVSDILRSAIDDEFNNRGMIVMLRDYLNFYYVKSLASKIKIETFTTTYENYPWEKICFMALRKYSPETRIIGYQHAPLSKASLSMRLSEHERNIIPMPDKIVTIGNVTKTFLETVGNYEKNKVEVGCALRFERHSTSKMGQRAKSCRVLLVLRGIPSVVRDSLRFVYRALKDNEKYKLTIRPHPALPPEKFKHFLDFDIFSCKNFSISANTSVEEDLKEADVVLYDASAVAIEALMMGIPVVNITLDTILSADPLFQCAQFRWTACSEEDLSRILDAICNLTDEEYYYQQKKAKEFVGEYVSEVTDVRLDAFI